MKHATRVIFALLVAGLASACPNPAALVPAGRTAFRPGGPTNPAPLSVSAPHLKRLTIGDGNDGTPATLADVQKYEALTEGTLVKSLPQHNAFTSIRVTRHPRLGALAAGDQEVGLGCVAPAEEDALFEADPNLLDEDQGVYSEEASSLSSQGFAMASLFHLAQVPGAVDLRPEMPPVVNQGDRGVCEICSVAGVLDHLYAKQANAPVKTASVQFLYWNYHRTIISKTAVNELWKDPGTISHYLGMILRREGNTELSQNSPYVPPEQGYLAAQDVPYRAEKYPPEPAEPDLAAVATKHLGPVADRIMAKQPFVAQGAQQTMLNTRDIPTLKRALADGLPVVIGYPVFQDDWSDRTAESDIIPDLTPDKVSRTGGHAVVLVGYQDDPQAPGGGYFLVRNSWGADWGNAGHCRVSYKMTTEYGDDAYTLTAYDSPFNAVYSVLYPPTEPGGPPLSRVAQTGPAPEPTPSQISIVAPSPKVTPAAGEEP